MKTGFGGFFLLRKREPANTPVYSGSSSPKKCLRSEQFLPLTPSTHLIRICKRAYPAKAGDAKSSVYGAKALGRQGCQVTPSATGFNE
jgi:hypothetical protein